MKSLSEKHPKAVVIGLVGKYYTAIGRDAVILSQEIGLKKFCNDIDFCNNMSNCMVGFPKMSYKKYIKKIISSEIAFAIYKRNKNDLMYFNNGCKLKDEIEVKTTNEDCPKWKSEDIILKQLKEQGEKNLEEFNSRFIKNKELERKQEDEG